MPGGRPRGMKLSPEAAEKARAAGAEGRRMAELIRASGRAVARRPEAHGCLSGPLSSFELSRLRTMAATGVPLEAAACKLNRSPENLEVRARVAGIELKRREFKPRPCLGTCGRSFVPEHRWDFMCPACGYAASHSQALV